VAYTPTTWQDNVTVVNAARMQNIETELSYLDPRVPTYGTTLPASPVDGQEAILVDSVTAPTYQWRFRYNAGSTLASKWEFMGGAPAYASVYTFETFTAGSGTWANLATNGPQFVLPRMGDYTLEGFCMIHAGTTAPDTPALGVSIGDTNPAIPVQGDIERASQYTNIWLSDRLTGIAVGSAIKLRYQSYGPNQTQFGQRVLRVTPLRVS